MIYEKTATPFIRSLGSALLVSLALFFAVASLCLGAQADLKIDVNSGSVIERHQPRPPQRETSSERYPPTMLRFDASKSLSASKERNLECTERIDCALMPIENGVAMQSVHTAPTPASGSNLAISSTAFDDGNSCGSALQDNPPVSPCVPVVILPGFGGSAPWDDASGVLGRTYRSIADRMAYNGLVAFLEGLGYVRDKTLFVLDYNFTRDMSDLARNSIPPKIEKIKSETGANKVTIIAHSQGGVVARAYLRENGTDNVDQLITVGTPYSGVNLYAENGGIGIENVFDSAVQMHPIWVEALVDDRGQDLISQQARESMWLYQLYESGNPLREHTTVIYGNDAIPDSAVQTVTRYWATITRCAGNQSCTSDLRPLYLHNLYWDRSDGFVASLSSDPSFPSHVRADRKKAVTLGGTSIPVNYHMQILDLTQVQKEIKERLNASPSGGGYKGCHRYDVSIVPPYELIVGDSNCDISQAFQVAIYHRVDSTPIQNLEPNELL